MKYRHTATLFLCLLAAALPAVVPLSLAEAGPTICVFKNLTGLECLGCGMTRAVCYVMHGQLGRALAHNKLVVIVMPLLAMVWFKYTFKQARILWPARR